MECKLGTTVDKIGNVKGINRYIMECKLKKGKEVVDRQVELIDTLWNVNRFGCFA